MPVRAHKGGVLIRAYVERCNNPPVKNLVSYLGPQMGVYGVPRVRPPMQPLSRVCVSCRVYHVRVRSLRVCVCACACACACACRALMVDDMCE
jgi:hypothetical protein